MDEFSAESITQLEDALRYPNVQRTLLQNATRLRELMNDIPARRWLFEQACQTENKAQATKARLLIIRILQSPSQIWYGGGSHLSLEIYEEALARTWEWFNRNFQSYIPERASFVTWFNHHLKWRIIDVQQEIDLGNKNRIHPCQGENGEMIDPLGIIPAANHQDWQETIRDWLELVQNDAMLRNCRMQNAPAVNGQDLLTRILQELLDSGEFCWQAIAQTYNVEPSSLRRFCRTRCTPRFQELWAR